METVTRPGDLAVVRSFLGGRAIAKVVLDGRLCACLHGRGHIDFSSKPVHPRGTAVSGLWEVEWETGR